MHETPTALGWGKEKKNVIHRRENRESSATDSFTTYSLLMNA